MSFISKYRQVTSLFYPCGSFVRGHKRSNNFMLENTKSCRHYVLILILSPTRTKERFTRNSHGITWSELKPHQYSTFFNIINAFSIRVFYWISFQRIMGLPQKFPMERLCPFLSLGAHPNTSQNRSVSSAAADTTLPPSGLWSMWSTWVDEIKRRVCCMKLSKRCEIFEYFQEFDEQFEMISQRLTLAVWPLNSWIFVIEGYFHKISWFSLNPWDEQISLWCFDQSNEQTCDPVSIEFKTAPELVFQNLIVLSAVPPPLASNPRWNGHHANAFTAALCCVNWSLGPMVDGSVMVSPLPLLLERWYPWLFPRWDMAASQRHRRFSFPPLANVLPSSFHLSPHTWSSRSVKRWLLEC